MHSHLDKLKELHKKCSFHKDEVEKAENCGCFHCCKTFLPTEVWDWVDGGETALCPHCRIDAVLPNVTDADTLKEMSEYWFSEASAT